MMVNIEKIEELGLDDIIPERLQRPAQYTSVSEKLFKTLGKGFMLPDGGNSIKDLADKSPGGAFDPRELEMIPAARLGYKAKWIVLRYNYYSLDWDITALRLKSLDNAANDLPWMVIIHGGNSNFYEFFLDPLHNPGLGQFLAQRVNVLLVTIPGYFKYGGWAVPPPKRLPQYLLDQDIPDEELRVRNTIYTNKMELEGLKRLVLQETGGDILIIGHSTGGELAFLSMGERELADRLKGRFLGWGSGGPANLRKEWEESVGIREKQIKTTSAYPPLWQLRYQTAQEAVKSGYSGPLHPCAKPAMTKLDIAKQWFFHVNKIRPNFRQIMQDIEHRGLVELRSNIEAQVKEELTTKSPVKVNDVLRDIYATNNSPLTGYKKMVWLVGKWDKGHWNKKTSKNAMELRVANQFRDKNPHAAIRILLFDLPVTHYGHFEMPQQVAGGLIATAQWLVK